MLVIFTVIGILTVALVLCLILLFIGIQLSNITESLFLKLKNKLDSKIIIENLKKENKQLKEKLDEISKSDGSAYR